MTSTVTKGRAVRSDLKLYDGLSETVSRKDSTGGTIVSLPINDFVDVLGAYGDIDAYNRRTIVRCTIALGSKSRTLVFRPGTWEIDDNLTIDSNFTCRVMAGAVFDVASGKTLTFSGPVIRDSNTWTSGSGTVTESGTRIFSGAIDFDGAVDFDSTVDLSGAVLQGGTPLVFEGATADAFETSLQVTDPTADRTVIVPDANIELCTPRGHISGLTLSNNASDATNDIDIAVGQAVDATGVYVLNLTTAITKRLDAAWAVGTNQGGLDTGAIANDVYHIWLIRRSDTGVVDALFSASATSPTMPTNYDQKRRIGAITRSAGAILTFSQYGDEFLLKVPVLDVDTANPGTSSVLSTLTVPDGVQVIALADVHLIDSTSTVDTALLVTSPDQTDTAASGSAYTLRIVSPGTTDDVSQASQVQVRTNTSAQVRYDLSNSDADITVRVCTKGWIDYRGRFS